MSKKTEYIVIRDGFWWGIIGDLFMYGILGALYWFNYTHLGNNGVLNVIFTLFMVVFITNLLSGKFKKVFYSPEAALDYLEELASNQTEDEE